LDDPEIRHVCPNCGRELPVGGAYCENCGAPPVSPTYNPPWIQALVGISVALLILPIAALGICLVGGLASGNGSLQWVCPVMGLIVVFAGALYVAIKYLSRKDQ
jgi:hypothetical protein